MFIIQREDSILGQFLPIEQIDYPKLFRSYEDAAEYIEEMLIHVNKSKIVIVSLSEEETIEVMYAKLRGLGY